MVKKTKHTLDCNDMFSGMLKNESRICICYVKTYNKYENAYDISPKDGAINIARCWNSVDADLIVNALNKYS